MKIAIVKLDKSKKYDRIVVKFMGIGDFMRRQLSNKFSISNITKRCF